MGTFSPDENGWILESKVDEQITTFTFKLSELREQARSGCEWSNLNLLSQIEYLFNSIFKKE